MHESELELDIGSQVVVDEVDLLLSVENLSAPYEPLVSLFIHGWYVRGPLWVLGRHCKIWHSHQSVVLKYGLNFLVLSEVDHSEEYLFVISRLSLVPVLAERV